MKNKGWKIFLLVMFVVAFAITSITNTKYKLNEKDKTVTTEAVVESTTPAPTEVLSTEASTEVDSVEPEVVPTDEYKTKWIHEFDFDTIPLEEADKVRMEADAKAFMQTAEWKEFADGQPILGDKFELYTVMRLVDGTERFIYIVPYSDCVVFVDNKLGQGYQFLDCCNVTGSDYSIVIFNNGIPLNRRDIYDAMYNQGVSGYYYETNYTTGSTVELHSLDGSGDVTVTLGG